ncbi:DUF1016 N-terminal domain-containing protein [Sphingobacterium nematocida]|uniref:DUF1016 N-terminal domain-containing protein n=1 Tax=Sphingobacterium nematocida TaxID=1513896 RepID=UPI00373FD7BA
MAQSTLQSPTDLLNYLADELSPTFGSAFSYRQLNWPRHFYRTFPIVYALCSQFNWAHYRTLITTPVSKSLRLLLFFCALRHHEQILISMFAYLPLLSNNRRFSLLKEQHSRVVLQSSSLPL